jgi:outer membrane protein OmpA-like peptidoglycan-associated protein
LAISGFLHAQTADELDMILTTQEITYLQAARLILTASDSLPNGGNAFVTAQENRWLPGRAKADSPINADDPISLGEVALLIMKSFGLKGGFLYTLFSNPRHACRDLAYVRIIQGRTDPGGHLNGGEFLQILSRTLAYTGDDETPATLPRVEISTIPPAEKAPVVVQIPPDEQPILFEESEANIVIEDTKQGRTVRLLNAVYFQADSAVLVEGSSSVLDELGKLLIARPGATVTLRAYTAPYGTREGRLAVSQNRAGFCLNYLQRNYGIGAERVQVELYGADQLPEWGRGPDGSFASVESFRCVEFIIHE